MPRLGGWRLWAEGRVISLPEQSSKPADLPPWKVDLNWGRSLADCYSCLTFGSSPTSHDKIYTGTQNTRPSRVSKVIRVSCGVMDAADKSKGKPTSRHSGFWSAPILEPVNPGAGSPAAFLTRLQGGVWRRPSLCGQRELHGHINDVHKLLHRGKEGQEFGDRKLTWGWGVTKLALTRAMEIHGGNGDSR